MDKLAVGKDAPDLALPTDSGSVFRLSEHRGSPVVIFFYPADDTEGCTIENMEFTAQMPAFGKLGAKVIGISPDSVEKHCAFRDKHKLGIPLAADPEHRAIEAYGVWGEKLNYGRPYMGLIRTTFLVGPGGNIAGIYPVPRIKGHAEKVLAAVRELVSAAY